MVNQLTPLQTQSTAGAGFSGRAVFALVSGVLAVFFPFPFGVIAGIAAIVAARGVRNLVWADEKARRVSLVMALSGAVLGAVGVLMVVGPFVVSLVFIGFGGF